MCSCIPILVPPKDLDKIIEGVEPKQLPLPKNFTSWFRKTKGNLNNDRLPDWYADNREFFK